MALEKKTGDAPRRLRRGVARRFEKVELLFVDLVPT